MLPDLVHLEPESEPSAVAAKGVAAKPENDDPTRTLVDALANAIRSLHLKEARGDLASLRRMDADEAIEPAFQRILVRVAPDASCQSERRDKDAQRLALMVKILALGMDREKLSDGYRNLGEMMAIVGVSERRVQGLMTAQGPTLDDLIVRLSRRLLRDGALPFLDIGRLILGSPVSVQNTRFKIAKGFWGTRSAAETDAQPNEKPAGGEPE